jgi:putative methionine-R-sulfoxide reductase with GAF domain
MFYPIQIKMKKFSLQNFRNQDRSISNSISESVDLRKSAEEPEANSVENMLQQILADIDPSVSAIKEYSETLLLSLARVLGISQGAFFLSEKKDSKKIIKFISGYAYYLSDTENLEFEYGHGLSGQVALDGKIINIDSIPEGYITILSGLGNSSSPSMIIFPIINKKEVVAVVEMASFRKFSNDDEELIKRLSASIVKDIIKLCQKKK